LMDQGRFIRCRNAANDAHGAKIISRARPGQRFCA
jgi:hypothetical protein